MTHRSAWILSLAIVTSGVVAPSAEAAKRNAALFLQQHGTTGDVLIITAPSVADDARFRRWWIRFQRSTMSPVMLETGYQWQTEVDVTGLLPTIAVPTLVIHRKDNVYHRVAFGKYIADRIPDAEWVELEGGRNGTTD